MKTISRITSTFILGFLLASCASTPATEGTASSPVALELSKKHAGSVEKDKTSYYVLSGVAGTAYTVEVTDLTESVYLTIYNNDSTYTSSANSTTSSQSNHIVSADGGSTGKVYIAVSSSSFATKTATYNIVVY